VGHAKYLETPLQANAEKFVQFVADQVKEALEGGIETGDLEEDQGEQSDGRGGREIHTYTRKDGTVVRAYRRRK
jgi:hypothetical protein